MIRFKNMKKIINPKFLYALPVACIGVLCTQQTTNAMFRNPVLKMPLIPTPGGIITFERQPNPSVLIPKKTSNTITTTTITTKSSLSPIPLSNSLPNKPITSSKIIITNTGNSGNTLRSFGDEITSNTTSANIVNLGSALRNSGDRFNQ